MVADPTPELPDAITCDQCGAEMRIFGIEPHPTVAAADLHTYVCDPCDAMKTKIVVFNGDSAAEPEGAT
jgi:hypothetical protein